MRIEIRIAIVLIIVITLALFWDQAMAAISGMTPMQVVEFLWLVTVKAAVLAICAWLASTVPHVVIPWLKLVKRNQRRAWRSGPNAQWKQQAPRMPRLTAEERMMLMVAKLQQQQPQQSRRSAQTSEPTEPQINW